MNVREIGYGSEAMREDGDKDYSGNPELTSCPWKKPPCTFLGLLLSLPLSTSFLYSFFLSTNIFELVEGVSYSPQPVTN